MAEDTYIFIVAMVSFLHPSMHVMVSRFIFFKFQNRSTDWFSNSRYIQVLVVFRVKVLEWQIHELYTTLFLCQILYLKCGHNWASEASPTLGCSIEISRDIPYFLG